MHNFFNNTKGQSLLEVVVALAIFALIGAALVSLAVGGFTGMEQGGEQTAAEALAQEGIDGVRSIRDNAWNEVIFNQSGVEISGSEWIFSGEGTSETIGQYTRLISFTDVCRDALLDDIVTCPSGYIDAHSKKITVTVSWPVRSGATNVVQRISYLTNWDSRDWVEDLTAEFSDGIFTNTENSATLGDGDGAIILQPQ